MLTCSEVDMSWTTSLKIGFCLCVCVCVCVCERERERDYQTLKAGEYILLVEVVVL